MLSVQEISRKIGCSDQWTRTLIRDGILKGEKIGNSWVVRESDLQTYIDSQYVLFSPESLEQELKESNKSNELVALSFFSGAMGLDLGLEKAGISFKLACESDKACQKTIQANRPNLSLIGDIWKYTAEDIRKIAKIDGDIDVIVGGPPCQAFSTAGARKGFEDERGNVFLYYIDLLLELRPKYIVIENVRGLLSAPLKHCPHKDRVQKNAESLLNQPGGALLYILEKLRSGGYNVSFNLYNSANFGVPQIRERVVIICSRDGGKVPYLTPTNSEDGAFGLPKWNTLRSAIDGLKECDHSNFPEKRLQYYRMLTEGQYWKHLPQDIQPLAMGKSFKLGGGKTGFYRRLAWDKPSCTLVTSPTMPATDICHPSEDRPLSIQEYKRIQMFPDNWILCGDLVKQYKQVGNAVPTGLGYAIGKAILAHMNGEKVEGIKNFPYSRYKNTDETSWEINTRKRLGIGDHDSIFEQDGVREAVKLKTDVTPSEK